MRISDWSSDVCSSDLWQGPLWGCAFEDLLTQELEPEGRNLVDDYLKRRGWNEKAPNKAYMRALRDTVMRSEEHTSELQSLVRISYAVFCLKKKRQINIVMKKLPLIPVDKRNTRCNMND